MMRTTQREAVASRPRGRATAVAALSSVQGYAVSLFLGHPCRPPTGALQPPASPCRARTANVDVADAISFDRRHIQAA
jgi:hypothetical protein